jgi:hypothetical protein
MGNGAMSETTTSVEFGIERLRENARAYSEHKRIVDAASKYDSLDDAVAALTDVWNVLETQIVDGGKFTPSIDLGFGSDNCSQIGAAILGRRTSITATRKTLAAMGRS